MNSVNCDDNQWSVSLILVQDFIPLRRGVYGFESLELGRIKTSKVKRSRERSPYTVS